MSGNTLHNEAPLEHRSLPVNPIRPTEGGSSLVEILVSIAVTGIVGLGLSHFSSVGYRLLTDSRERAIAQQVVASTLEELSLRDPSLLASSTYSEPITRGRFSLIRTVTITSNVDNSRSVEVSAHKDDPAGTPRTLASMTARLSTWSAP